MAYQANPQLIEEMRWQLERISHRKAENERLINQLDAADSELGALTATASSPDRLVTVQAGPGGVIQDVSLTEDALRTDAGTLSRTITATIREATANAAKSQLEIVRQQVGGHVNASEVLGPHARLLDRHVAEPEQDTAAQPPADAHHEEPVASVLTNDTTRPASTAPRAEKPVSESDAFLRNLGLHDDH
ncbi:MAG: hypothetical protein GEU98_06995 [Pseudonocardiaceae bacterium]|nr:hypothetical protein [Pseudonocardiaceae bacterium]